MRGFPILPSEMKNAMPDLFIFEAFDKKLTDTTPKSLSISLFMAPISLSMSLVRELEVEEERAEG